MELFPQLRAIYPKFLVGTWSGNPASWRKERRICSEDVFDIYFVMGVPMGEVSKEELYQFVAVANQSDKLIDLLRIYQEQGRIARLLDWMNDVVEDLTKDGVLGLCKALIEFGDELFNSQRNIVDPGTDFRMPWLISQLLRRIEDQTSRFNWFLDQVNNSNSLYTVVQQVSWNKPSQTDLNSIPLFDNHQLSILTESCIQKMVLYAKNGKLLKTKNLAYILFRWKEWSTNTKELLSYIKKTIGKSDTALVFITGFVWESGSYTFGDYVEKTKWDIDAKSLRALVDINKLTNTLSPLREKPETEFSEKELLAIKLFFEKVVVT